MIRNNKKAQSTLEYIILVTAVIAVMILFLNQGGFFRTQLESTYNDATDVMTGMADKFSTSRQ